MPPEVPDKFRPYPPGEPGEYEQLVKARMVVDVSLNRAWQAFHGDINKSSVTSQDAAQSAIVRSIIVGNTPQIDPDKKLTEQELKITQSQGDKIIKEVHSHPLSFERVSALTAAQARMQRLRQEVTHEGSEETRKITEVYEQVYTLLPEIIGRTLRTMDRYALLRSRHPEVLPNADFERLAVDHVNQLGTLMRWRVRVAHIAKLVYIDKDFGRELVVAVNELANDRVTSVSVVENLLKEKIAFVELLWPAGQERDAVIRQIKNYKSASIENTDSLITVLRKTPLAAADSLILQKTLQAVQGDILGILRVAVDIEPDPAEVAYTDFLNRILQANYDEDAKLVEEPASTKRTRRLAELKKQRQELLTEQATTLHDRGAQNIGDLEELLIPEALRTYIPPSTTPRGPERTAEQLAAERKFMSNHVSKLSGAFRRHFKMVLEGDEDQAGLFDITPEIWREKQWNELRPAFITVLDGIVRLRALARPSSFLRQLGVPFGKDNAEFQKHVMGDIFEKMGLPPDFNPWNPQQWNDLTPEQRAKLTKALESVSSNIVKHGPKIRASITVFEGDLSTLDRLRALLPPDDLQNITPDKTILGNTSISGAELQELEAAKPVSKEKLLAMYLVLLQKMRRDWGAYSTAMAECSGAMLDVLDIHSELAAAAFDAAGKLQDDLWLEVYVLGGLYTAGRFGRWGGWTGKGNTGGVFGLASEGMGKIPGVRWLRYMHFPLVYAGGGKPLLPWILRVPKDFLLTAFNPLTVANGLSRLAIDPAWWMWEKLGFSPSKELHALMQESEDILKNAKTLKPIERLRRMKALEKRAINFQQRIAGLSEKQYEVLAKQLLPKATQGQLDILREAHLHGKRLADGTWEMETLMEKHRIMRGYEPVLVQGKEVPRLGVDGNPVQGLTPEEATKALRTGMAGEPKAAGRNILPLSVQQKTMVKRWIRSVPGFALRGGIVALQAYVTYADWKELSQDLEEAEENEKNIENDLKNFAAQYPKNNEGTFRALGGGKYAYFSSAGGEPLFTVDIADIHTRARSDADTANLSMDIASVLGTGALWLWEGKKLTGPLGWGLGALEISFRTGSEALEFQKHYTFVENCPQWLWVRITARAGAQGLFGRRGDELMENRMSDFFVKGKSRELKEKVLFGEFVSTLERIDRGMADQLQQMCANPEETNVFYEREYKELILPLFHQFLFMRNSRADISWSAIQRLDFHTDVGVVGTVGVSPESFHSALELTAKAFRAHLRQKFQMNTAAQLAQLRKTPQDVENNVQQIALLEQALFELNLKPVLGRRLTDSELGSGKTQVQQLMEQVRDELDRAGKKAAESRKGDVFTPGNPDDSWVAMMFEGNRNTEGSSSRTQKKVLNSIPRGFSKDTWVDSSLGLDIREAVPVLEAHYILSTHRDITIFTNGIKGLDQRTGNEIPQRSFLWFLKSLESDHHQNPIPEPRMAIAYVAETTAATRSDNAVPELVEDRALLIEKIASLQERYVAFQALGEKIRKGVEIASTDVKKRVEVEQDMAILQEGLPLYFFDLKQANDISMEIKQNIDRRKSIGIPLRDTIPKFTEIGSFDTQVENILFEGMTEKPFVENFSSDQEIVVELGMRLLGENRDKVAGVIFLTQDTDVGQLHLAVAIPGTPAKPQGLPYFLAAIQSKDGSMDYGLIQNVGTAQNHLLKLAQNALQLRQKDHNVGKEAQMKKELMEKQGQVINKPALSDVVRKPPTHRLELIGKDAAGNEIFATKIDNALIVFRQIGTEYFFQSVKIDEAAGDQAPSDAVANMFSPKGDAQWESGSILLQDMKDLDDNDPALIAEQHGLLRTLLTMPRAGETPEASVRRIATYASKKRGATEIVNFELELADLLQSIDGKNAPQMRTKMTKDLFDMLIHQEKMGGVEQDSQAAAINIIRSKMSQGEYGKENIKNIPPYGKFTHETRIILGQ